MAGEFGDVHGGNAAGSVRRRRGAAGSLGRRAWSGVPTLRRSFWSFLPSLTSLPQCRPTGRDPLAARSYPSEALGVVVFDLTPKTFSVIVSIKSKSLRQISFFRVISDNKKQKRFWMLDAESG
ncbi:hypothetical protein [Rhodobium gokarnense]|uniref:Uncharacterized protein n=1 Tax=Rhodobium gokarnense TaxID=364296 RepID=A0ABT3H6C5_9HYPH|nr:hypothetical protein [Rhodobium gokarnense]MCW2305946.1 hypothetical protein [Rhodobium gokarnense]